jgi:hypothetical protein
MQRQSWVQLSLLIIVMTCVTASAQIDYVAWGDAQIKDIREEMRSRMTSSEADLEESISYHVIDDSSLNAMAVPKEVNGKREIRVSSALLEVIDWINTVEAVSVLWDKGNCIDSYLDYLQRSAKSNGMLISEGYRGSVTMSAFSYMKSKPSICPQVSPDVITNDVRQADTLRSRAIHESIKWVLLHEYAHHLHGDVHSGTLKMVRDQERKADAYASIAMLDPPEYPTQAAAVMLLFCSLEGFSTAASTGDHPSGLERLKAMVDATRSSPRWKEVLNDATPAQRRQIEASLDQLDRMAASIPKD